LDQAWVYTHKGQQDTGEWGQPINLTHKFAIVMGFPQDWDLWLTCAQASIPGHLDEWSHYHKMSDVAIRLASAIRDMGYPARAQIQSNYTCILPPLAVDAGLGEQCLIGLCLTKEYGLAYRLCAVTTDLPLAPDPLSKLGIEDFCNRCNKCVEACPSGALSKKEKIEINGRRVWKQNVSQCFKYWNAKGVSCSICWRACPWSKPRSFPHTLVANLSQSIPLLRPLILKADDIVYGKIPRNYPPPKWMQYKAQQMSLRRRLEYWFDKL
jgi:reductive dehalogenase